LVDFRRFWHLREVWVEKVDICSLVLGAVNPWAKKDCLKVVRETCSVAT